MEERGTLGCEEGGFMANDCWEEAWEAAWEAAGMWAVPLRELLAWSKEGAGCMGGGGASSEGGADADRGGGPTGGPSRETGCCDDWVGSCGSEETGDGEGAMPVAEKDARWECKAVVTVDEAM